ncbi:hypothetical protein Marme_3920 [Marinomonas mediterranea MMB-1]|jgi:hypothetical protein|uniref:Uncharacterized protein n=1 Tax=Marinomonas mediterranea (strain ATCC 700492 / JCM 21426 / NBRC 103028 / MMB-1) TaxID=717774 RepID=F2JYK1_MARM1|nr:hypothetical protein Marme_3920 [Marinomonas mediterranea MMB-1]
MKATLIPINNQMKRVTLRKRKKTQMEKWALKWIRLLKESVKQRVDNASSLSP